MTASAAVNATPLPPVLDGDDRWGFNHVTPGFGGAQLARNAGGRWNRWEFRWERIQPVAGHFDWAESDRLVNESEAAGLEIQGVLIGLPGWALDPANGLPRGIGLAWDAPGNLWTQYVRDVVGRYRGKIRYWEVWNEPDSKPFWSQTIGDYYQMLRVTYLAVKASDPTAQVLLGGLTYWHDPTFLDALLDLVSRDASARANNGYFDIVSWHVYSRPAEILERVPWTRTRLAVTVGAKPIWINEANVPPWDDSPFNDYRPFQWAATTAEQASFVIQLFAYALATGVERVIVYRFQDVGEKESWGFQRTDGSLRPAYAAFQVASQLFSHATSVSMQGNATVERVDIQRGGQRVSVLWNRTAAPTTAQVPATYPGAVVIDPTGARRGISASGGSFNVALSAATANLGSHPADFIIGGTPQILVQGPTHLEIDRPAPTTDNIGKVRIEGWAADQNAPSGTGVDRVDLYLDGPTGVGNFLGTASYGGNRPDVARALGAERFGPSGWTFEWDTSQAGAGSHSLFVYAYSNVNKAWYSRAQMVRVGLGEDTAIVVDRLPAVERGGDQVRFGGWAVDRKAPSDTGISRVDLYLDGPTGVGSFLGTATYGEGRPDVARSLGRADFERSGWTLSWSPRGIPGGFHEVYAYAFSPRLDAWSAQVATFVLDQAPPRLVIDRPSGDAQVSGMVEVAGWAVDRRAEGATGVDRVQVYLDGGVGRGTLLGEAVYGGARPDVAAALGGAHFTSSGWTFQWNTAGVPEGRHIVHVVAHSALSNLWTDQARVVFVRRSG